jgi:hypothetical protein
LAFIHDKNVYRTGRLHCGNASQFAALKNCTDHKSHKRYGNAHKVGGQKMPAKAGINFLLHWFIPPQQINHAIVVAFGVLGRLVLVPESTAFVSPLAARDGLGQLRSAKDLRLHPGLRGDHVALHMQAVALHREPVTLPVTSQRHAMSTTHGGC